MKLLDTIELPVSVEIPNGLPSNSETDSAEYEQLCKLVGYGSRWDPSAHPLALWCQRNEVPVYDEKGIETYLSLKKAQEEWSRATLKRHPMRMVDKDWRSEPVYADPIPVQVLRLCGALVKEFGADVRFEVATVEEDKDPFLYVEHKKSREVFCMAHWDEPGFSITGH